MSPWQQGSLAILELRENSGREKRRSGAVVRRRSASEKEAFSTEAQRNPAGITMAENNPELELKDAMEPSPDASPIEEDAETPQENSNGVKTEAEESQKDKPEGKEKSSGGRKSSRYHPYKDRHGGSGDKKSSQRNRVFISNIPYDMKWQAIKDLMREKVGEVTYVELFKDAEGKSRVSAVEAFKDEEFVKKAIEVMNKYDLNGRPLNIKEMLFDRQMHVKMDDKSLPPDDFRSGDKAPQLPRGLGGIGMGLGPGGQPINTNRLSGGGMGSMGPGGMDGSGFGGMNRMGGMGGGFGGMDGVGMGGGFGGRDMTPMGRMGDMYRSGGMGNMGMDRMSGFDRMGGNMEMSRSFSQFGGSSGHMGGDRGAGSKGGCQIFVRNLSYDLTWQKLKEKFSHCGQVMYAEIKMENGKSKGCGTVRFDSPESAEQACRLMNGTKINGREVDVRIDRNA
ncbi:hypothetical protein PDJAM_G00218290 [Pangasius djambal]|uniref:Uncharacterized protein n=1 Tax=Pangasius djambal TaxID=1691987 RepID=A0ACC5YCC5_9TELE|nr:hypothetical protein [Pangasius djambal]